MGAEQYRRREPLEKHRNGLTEGHVSLIILAQKRIHDLKAVNSAAMLHVFRQKGLAARLERGSYDQSIPEGDFVEPMQVDCSENVSERWLEDSQCPKDLNFSRVAPGSTFSFAVATE